jgi:EpsI family protein
MRVRLRLAAAAIGFLLPALALARWTGSPAASASDVGLPRLPDPIGSWALAGEGHLSDTEMALISPDAHLVHGYQAPGRPPILLYIGLYGGRAGYDAGAHDPEVCYPAQGWQIMGTRDVEVALADGEKLHAKLLDVHKGAEREAVLHWFQPAARWPASAAVEQLARIFDAVAGRPQYAFVRLSTRMQAVGPLEAERELADFASQIAWPVRDALGGEANEGPLPLH